MARIRTIKPEFFTSSDIVSLTPLSRLFYVSLWCEADRAGRLQWSPVTLKYRYLPGDKCDVDVLGDELLRAGLIRLYRIDGKIYADIPSFSRHQVINNREADSVLPPHVNDASFTRESGVQAEGRKEGKEGKESTPIVPQGDEYTLEFEEFWKAYPSRGDARNPKPPAFKSWLKALERGGSPVVMIAAAKRYASTEAAGTKFCAQAATWLNQDDWRAVAPASSTAAPSNPEDSQWRARVTTWMSSKLPIDQRFWNRDQWGSPPNYLDTRVPKKILDETGACNEPPPFFNRSA